MELTERKVKILNAIVRNYLETGEPVGSRTISKYTDLNLSSATIRNEMSDLEEMGLILQPHTSAGRIPSDKGYRMYVDAMLEEKTREVDEIREDLLKKEEKLDNLLKQTARLLAVNTNYATMVSAPRVNSTKLKLLQLFRVNSRQLLAVVVLEKNVIKNSIIELTEDIQDETVLKLNILLNTNLTGMALEDINLGMIASLKQQAGIHSQVIGELMDAVASAIREEEDLEIYTSGANNIFKYPELANRENASEIINNLEEKEVLNQLARVTMEEENKNGIQVYIGSESPVDTMKDCSIVTATYDLGDGMRGTIGIIGPKRMDYEKVVDNLKHVMHSLDSIYER